MYIDPIIYNYIPYTVLYKKYLMIQGIIAIQFKEYNVAVKYFT